MTDNRRGPTPRTRYTVQHPDWMAAAACVDTEPELWHPLGNTDKPNWLDLPMAKLICRGCPVRHECLAHAFATGDRFGIYGGATPSERETIQRRRRERSA
jgi:WhiB family redox-sensing transcriptional regulator